MQFIMTVINLSVYFLWVLFLLLFLKYMMSILPASGALWLGDTQKPLGCGSEQTILGGLFSLLGPNQKNQRKAVRKFHLSDTKFE